MQILNYPLKDCNEQLVSLPDGAIVTSVQRQDGVTCMWACVDPLQKKRSHRIHRLGTGWDLPENVSLRFICTMQDGPFVWHYFLEVRD